ncbi:unnamed protein product [Gongylonema pulchrum]|uniref:Secreted protein n=1 Tax=Gongylonema pulchrum TaxID=637853 RepID=A0A183CXP9_9BILA|nr:unnamed protein product [Gongylonema pulchrum]
MIAVVRHCNAFSEATAIARPGYSSSLSANTTSQCCSSVPVHILLQALDGVLSGIRCLGRVRWGCG